MPVSLKNLLMLTLLVAMTLTTNGATRSKARAIDADFLHRIWQFEDGLPQNCVQAVTQTRDGYLWLATQKGLSRFDGVDFVTFTPQNTPELKNWNFTSLCETRDGSLWIGTEGSGVNRFLDGKFYHYTTNNGLSGNVIRTFREMRNGELWIGSTTGITIFKDGKFSEFKRFEWPTTFAVRAIVEDKKGRIWIGGGIGLHCLIDGKLTTYGPQNSKEKILENTVRALYEAPDGKLWVGTSEGVFVRMDGQILTRYTKEDGLPDYIVTTIFEDRAGSIWVGTYGGLARIVNGRMATILTADGSPFDQIFTLTEDLEGNLWAGSKEGLSQLRQRIFKAFTLQQGLGHNNVMSMIEARDGNVWVATWGGGLDRIKDGKVNYSINRQTFPMGGSKQGLTGDTALSLAESRDGGIWFGIDFDGGLGRWKDGKLTFYTKKDGLIDSAVRALHEDREGTLWIATRGAPYVLKDGVLTRLQITNGWTGEIVRVITEDPEGTMWFGTSGGLTSHKEGKFKTYKTRDGLATNQIVAIYPDREGNVWAGTMGGGLARLKDGIARVYTTEQGLFSDDVYDILEDALGYLWMTCRFGVYRVNKRDFDAVDAGTLKQVSSASYNKYDGLVSLECNSVGRPTGLKTSDGRLWFGTTKGIGIVDPKEDIRVNERPPPVRITRVVGDKKLLSSLSSPEDQIVVPAGRGELEVHYTGLSYVVPEKNTFKYKLEGFDEDWVDAGARRAAYYSRLKPGIYRFKVMASNNDGIWNDKGAEVTIELEPHFYERDVFYAGCVLGMGALVVTGYRWNVRKLKKRHEDLQTVVEERTKHLKAEISERQRVQAEMVDVHRQLLEVSRKAGMAEVASGVLHNIGNVLNSVNVSTTLITERLRNSRHSVLKKMSVMIREHSDDLASFFSRDPRGQKLPEFMSQLSEHISTEHSLTTAEIEALRKNVDHIKDILAMQQKFARVGGVIESVKISALIEDALQIAEAGWSRRPVDLRRDFAQDPVISTDKHKVLQILVNLLRNAKMACDDCEKERKQIVIRTVLAGSLVRISIEDNGVGIAPENITRIFSHGFTTRKEGHGFGLHSSALAARELNGSLTAGSPGPGLGAVFTLEIPVETVREKPEPAAKKDPVKVTKPVEAAVEPVVR